ncbi:hypothetical protein DL766_005975 [Monosporascus sp. MC13-8B]|uniref:Uncharacterized protein n=1 Tax=Monosporascus cannonballus TaxID=155416 RepID=A0ABY0HBT7_9PEZI|nr:hypothetical protein DL762_004498 [Monosporascus cannonballus]RYO94704.1 hypothetical protein DL763_003978 [Monosporascus cannonballus]RYP28230.1 hypothetical protein DL766_005975 [Monosporascus sp. MC13-8B]
MASFFTTRAPGNGSCDATKVEKSKSKSDATSKKPSTSASSGPSVLSTKRKRDDDEDGDERVDAKYAAAPKGANLGLKWDETKRRHVAMKKDHFTGKVRSRSMIDDMWDNMSKTKLEEHAKRRRLTKSVSRKNNSSRTCTLEGTGFRAGGTHEA